MGSSVFKGILGGGGLKVATDHLGLQKDILKKSIGFQKDIFEKTDRKLPGGVFGRIVNQAKDQRNNSNALGRNLHGRNMNNEVSDSDDDKNPALESFYGATRKRGGTYYG